MHADGVEAGLESGAAREHLDVPAEEVEQVIARSKALSSVARLSIYAEAYYARLLECLGEEFPQVKQTLGEETFNGFAFGYLQAYPSRSYTLGHLGDNFARYLAETRPERESTDDQNAPDWPEFLVDLATLEWTFNLVFDGPGVEREPLLDAESLRAVPPDHWSAVRLQTVPCLKLLALRFPVNAYYTAMRRGEQPEIPAAADSWLAITRRNYIVRRHELTRPQYELLSALIAGETLGAAIERTLQLPDMTFDTLAGELPGWFQSWTAEGYFQRLAVE